MVPPTPKRMMWRVTEAPYLENVAKVFVLFLCGVQLVLRSSVLTVLDLDEVNVTWENAEIFGSVLSGESGSVGGGWRCWRSAPGLLHFPLPSLKTKNPPPFIASLLFFCRDGSNQYSIWTSGGKAFVWDLYLGENYRREIHSKFRQLQTQLTPWKVSHTTFLK